LEVPGGARDAAATLATMVEDVYVNHVPVLTGGSGKSALQLFYERDFIPKRLHTSVRESWLKYGIAVIRQLRKILTS
jgi:hypothetical protein